MAGTIWNGENQLFPAQELHNSPKHLKMWYHAGFKGGDVFYVITCTSVTVTLTIRMIFGNLHLLTLRIAVVVRGECSFRQGCLRELARSLSYSPASVDPGRIFSLLVARLL